MKTSRTILNTLFLLFVIIGCQSGLLETIPNDRISTAIFWKTAADAEFAANAIYPTLDGLNYLSYDGLTDIALTNPPFNANVDIQRGFITSATPRFLTEWNNAYSGIRRANDFMDNIDRVEGGDPNLINRLKGEVMTLRAYHYIKLVMFFGDVPLIDTGIGIDEGRNILRTPKNQVWDFIEMELEQAAAWLPLNNNGRVNRGAANGLKARAMLYAGRFAKAVEAAQKVMQSGEHSLFNSYFNLFQYAGQNNSEIILSRQYARDVNSHNIYSMLAPWSQIPGSAGSVYVPTAEMVDLYEMTNGLSITSPESGFDPMNPYANRDPRLGHSVFLSEITPMPDGRIYGSTPGSNGPDAVQITVYSTASGYNIRKYVANEDYTNPANSGLNITLMRFAEILLIYVEAKIELGEIDQSVYEAINQIRQRPTVNMPPITAEIASSQEEMREIVRKERTVELAFEGFRLFDIRRWGIAEDVMPGLPKGRTYLENGELKQIVLNGFDRFFDVGKDYLWPIPQRERELNQNLTQNPGF